MGTVTIELTPKQVESNPQVKGAGKPQLKLSRKQLLKAVCQLSVKDKILLKNQLEVELKPVLDQRRAEFGQAVAEIWEAYKEVPQKEVERDVAAAVKEVRERRYAAGAV